VTCPAGSLVHPDVMLTGHHFGWTAWSIRDPGVVERLDDVVMLQRARLFHGRRPELQTPVQTRARTAGGELGVTRIEPVVLLEQLPAERVADALIVARQL
jgi:hypothetical protein